MIQERNALMEHVYPKLKKLCREKFQLEFQVLCLCCWRNTASASYELVAENVHIEIHIY